MNNRGNYMENQLEIYTTIGRSVAYGQMPIAIDRHHVGVDWVCWGGFTEHNKIVMYAHVPRARVWLMMGANMRRRYATKPPPKQKQRNRATAIETSQSFSPTRPTKRSNTQTIVLTRFGCSHFARIMQMRPNSCGSRCA